VLDIYEFEKFHPGGKFVLQHNVGRDITKFFIGAYNLKKDNKVN
jgi:cytochrome b involved in lipid metabolism